MQYFSLNNKKLVVDFKTASIQGQAPDKGLYFPEHIPQIPENFLAQIKSLSDTEIAYQVMKPYIGNCIDDNSFRSIINETFNFPIPLVAVSERIFSLELYHGPTLAFKDVGARFMSRCLGYFLKNNAQKVTVLVATSGDTGGAVANGFYNVAGVDVVILYPKGKVSVIQEKQLTTLGKNITALEVAGSFDDCQAMVKSAFLDQDLNQQFFLTSANSINVARWLPQQVYYFLAYKQWLQHSKQAPVFCVPSGNFGNIAAGIVAYKSGLPVHQFLAATNANDIVPQFMQTKIYTAQKAIPTISNAMDVGNPSNFVRIQNLFENLFEALSAKFSSVSVTDELTKATLLEVYQKHKYLCDTHGAVAYKALKDYLQINKELKGIFLETAHPIKFFDVVEPIIGQTLPIPESIKPILNQEKKSAEITADFAALKTWLMK